MTIPARERRRTADLHQAELHKPATSPSASARLPNDPKGSLELAIGYRSPSELTPPRRALRKPSSRQGAALRASITDFGFLNPILVDGEGRIVCGYARWLAARDLGLEQVPVICATHLGEEQLRLYAIAENRIGELSEWDSDALRLEFKELSDLDFSLELNLELSGFAMSEIDDLLIEEAPGETVTSGHPSHPPVSKTGDLWQLGEHRLYCGDALEEKSYTAVMGEDRARIVFCDPPYNQPMRNISGQARKEFAMGSGEMNPQEFTAFLQSSFTLMARFSVDGAIHYQCMDWHHLREMLDAGEAVYARQRNLIVWNKGKGGMGSFYRSQHEFIYVWQVGKATPINNFGLGESGRYRTNVWDYQGNNTFHASRDEELDSHPTVKPIPLIADALRDCSHRGDIVLDAFGGAGSTLLAAEHTGRRARLIEIDPGYCDATIERWQARTGKEAAHVESGKSWSETAQERGIDLAQAPDPDRKEVV